MNAMVSVRANVAKRLATAGRRCAHLAARSHHGVGRARIGWWSRKRSRSSAKAPALA